MTKTKPVICRIEISATTHTQHNGCLSRLRRFKNSTATYLSLQSSAECRTEDSSQWGAWIIHRNQDTLFCFWKRKKRYAAELFKCRFPVVWAPKITLLKTQNRDMIPKTVTVRLRLPLTVLIMMDLKPLYPNFPQVLMEKDNIKATMPTPFTWKKDVNAIKCELNVAT